MKESLVKVQAPRFRFASLFVPALLAISAAPASAYFLSLEQKGQLLADGVIVDTAANLYNVRIVPGYGRSAEFTRDFWRAGARSEKRGAKRMGKGLVEVPLSLRHLGDYGSAKPYAGMADGARDAWHMEKTLYGKFMGSDLAGAWETYWGNAARAHRRKSFGWWIAYPWATGKGTLNATLRVGTGVPLSALAAAYGLALRPAYEVAKPAVLVAADATLGAGKTVWGAGEVTWGALGQQAGGGVLLPLVTATWNTTVGVPLAIAGKEPTPGSVDGWWVSMLPGSPDYDQGLDERSRLRLGGLDSVLEYEMARFRHERARDSLDALRKAALDSLDREKGRLDAAFRARMHEDFVRTLGGRTRPGTPASRDPGDREMEYLTRLLSESYADSPEYLALEDSARAALVERVAREWGANILATPREALGDPYRKTGPHTVLGEEAREVFKLKAARED
jgi:hypothetical protein